MIQLFKSWISDRVFSVRKAIVDAGLELFVLLGNEWSEKNLYKYFADMSNSQNYLLRQTFLYFVQVMDLFSFNFNNNKLKKKRINRCALFDFLSKILLIILENW
jgi:hypothetical protein